MPMLRLQQAQNRPLTRKIKNAWPRWPSWPSYPKTTTKPPIFQSVQDGQQQIPWPSCPSPPPRKKILLILSILTILPQNPNGVPLRPKFIPMSVGTVKSRRPPLRHGRRNPDVAGAKHREGTDAEIPKLQDRPIGTDR